jgi:hypothetical protein
VFDSWVQENPREQADRSSSNHLHLRLLFNHFSASQWAGPGWDRADWQVVSDATTYTQTNDYDCGVHALRNVQDLMYDRRVLRFHDAKLLRRRYAFLLEMVVSSEEPRFIWGDEIPGDEVLTQRWRDGVPARDGAARNGPDRQRPGAQQNEGGHLGDLGLLLQSLTPGTLLEPDPPVKHILVPYREAFVAILNATGGAEGLTLGEVALRYITVCRHLGSATQTLANVRYHALQLFNRSNTGVRVVSTDEDGQKRYLVRADLPESRVSSSELVHFGQSAMLQYAKMDYLKDDIETRPVLLCMLGRKTKVTQKSQKGIPNAKSAMLNRLDLNARYYLDVHNGRAEDPVEVQTADEVHLRGKGDEDRFYLHNYLLPERSSSCPVFQGDSGNHQPPDITMMAILKKLNDRSRHRRLVGDGRPLVIWVVFGVDSWSTSPETPRILVTSYPHLRHRITMAMPSNRVDRIPYVFQERHHVDGVGGLSWAHFDVEVVRDIQCQLEEDPRAPLPAIRRDQAALLHFLRQVQNWKEMKWVDDRYAQHHGDRHAPNYINAKACEIGEELMNSLRRNFISVEGVEKKCTQCQTTTSDSWHRCQQNLGDVVCQGCHDPEFEDPARTSLPPDSHQVEEPTQEQSTSTALLSSEPRPSKPSAQMQPSSTALPSSGPPLSKASTQMQPTPTAPHSAKRRRIEESVEAQPTSTAPHSAKRRRIEESVEAQPTSTAPPPAKRRRGEGRNTKPCNACRDTHGQACVWAGTNASKCNRCTKKGLACGGVNPAQFKGKARPGPKLGPSRSSCDECYKSKRKCTWDGDAGSKCLMCRALGFVCKRPNGEVMA